jgi:peptidoglycan/LPS O-acetylase OafA/YrhL
MLLRVLGYSDENGDFSYGTYIYAFPIQQLITMFFGGRMNPYLNMIISIPLIILLAFLSWNFVEKPCLIMKNIPFHLLFKLKKEGTGCNF